MMVVVATLPLCVREEHFVAESSHNAVIPSPKLAPWSVNLSVPLSSVELPSFASSDAKQSAFLFEASCLFTMISFMWWLSIEDSSFVFKVIVQERFFEQIARLVSIFASPVKISIGLHVANFPVALQPEEFRSLSFWSEPVVSNTVLFSRSTSRALLTLNSPKSELFLSAEQLKSSWFSSITASDWSHQFSSSTRIESTFELLRMVCKFSTGTVLSAISSLLNLDECPLSVAWGLLLLSRKFRSFSSFVLQATTFASASMFSGFIETQVQASVLSLSSAKEISLLSELNSFDGKSGTAVLIWDSETLSSTVDMFVVGTSTADRNASEFSLRTFGSTESGSGNAEARSSPSFPR